MEWGEPVGPKLSITLNPVLCFAVSVRSGECGKARNYFSGWLLRGYPLPFLSPPPNPRLGIQCSGVKA